MTDSSMDVSSIVGTFVESLEFKKKKIGGIDEMDALGKIEELAGLYEERINDLVRQLDQAKRDAETAARRTEASPHADAELARLRAELAEERSRAEGLAAKLKARERSAPAAPSSDDFMRTLQEVRADVLEKARNEAASIVSRARENADTVANAERERRDRAVEAARTARGQAESAMRKLADALGDVEALESGLAGGASAAGFGAQDVYARLRRADVPSPLDPWEQPESR